MFTAVPLAVRGSHDTGVVPLRSNTLASPLIANPGFEVSKRFQQG
jgi:hypothetical protein